MASDLEIRPAQGQDMEPLRVLFREYAAIVGSDICFQSFEAEMAALPGQYTLPGGGILVADSGEELAGCVALRPFDDGRCEMKRLYVRRAYRSSGLGRRLVERILTIAASLGYRSILLDTLPSMTSAIVLYRSLGFREIARYGANPVFALCFERILDTSQMQKH